MAIATPVSVEEYLSTSYEGPAPEYLDGEIVERPLPTQDHSDVQFRLSGILYRHAQQGRLVGRPELHLRLNKQRFRVADFAVYLGTPPLEPIPETPPQIIAEILSPDDRMSRVLDKLDEYERWGVNRVWLIDPHRRQFSVFRGGRLYPAEELAIPELEITVTARDLFD